MTDVESTGSQGLESVIFKVVQPWKVDYVDESAEPQNLLQSPIDFRHVRG